MKNCLSILFLFCTHLAIGQPTDTCTNTLRNGLIAYYPFSGNAQDQSGNSNNGTVTGAILTTDRFGRENSAYSFNGSSDFIQINKGLQLSQNYTVSAWVNTNAVNTNWQSVIGKYESLLGPYWFGLHLNKASMWVSNGFFGYVYFDSDSLIQTNKWIHLVWTGQGTTGTIYINGVKSGTKTIPAMTQNNDLVTIGKQALWQGIDSYCWFNGKLDDIRVYNNRAFSACQVRDLYNQERLRAPVGTLVACYDLDNNANDAINQLHGVVRNTPSTTGRNGLPNTALQFRGDSSSYVLLPNNNLLRPDTLSVSLWVNPNTTAINQYLIFYRYNVTVDFEAFSMAIYQGKFRLLHFPNTNPIDSRTVAQTNNWYHLASVFRGDSLFFYINGVLEGAAKSNGLTQYMANRSFVLGGTNETLYNRPYNGRIDDLRIYSKALTATDISALLKESPLCKITTALQDLGKLDFSVFPNPATQELNVQLLNTEGGNFHLQITDLTGKRLLEKKMTEQQTQLDISFLPSGMYLIVVTSPEKHRRKVLKFVKN